MRDFGDKRSTTWNPGPKAADVGLAPGKRTLVEMLPQPPASAPQGTAPASEPVQRKAESNAPTTNAPSGPRLTALDLFGRVQRKAVSAEPDVAAVHASAQQGIATAASPLPHAETIQRAFGRHDISGIKAHTGAGAAASATAMGAKAYATGDHVVLGERADLHTVAHEAAHVIQQRGGVQLKGGVGQEGDAYERHADEVAEQVVQGKSAESLLDRYAGGGPSAAGSAAGGPIQRYVEFTHPTEGRMQMSESHEFFKPANAERELWAKRENIDLAAQIMSIKKGGILSVAAGQAREFLSQTYHRVVVRDRVGTTEALASSSSSSSSSSSNQQKSPLQLGADGPFDCLIKWLAEHDGETLGQLMASSMKLMNPFPFGTYAYGAFSAIRIQQDLEIESRIKSLGAETAAPIVELVRFLTDWRGRIDNVNSEQAHSFNFMCTECGGFSKMVMPPGKDRTQAGAEVGDSMRVDGLGDLPGPWQNHYAAVIMTDPRGDQISLESAAGMDPTSARSSRATTPPPPRSRPAWARSRARSTRCSRRRSRPLVEHTETRFAVRHHQPGAVPLGSPPTSTCQACAFRGHRTQIR